MRFLVVKVGDAIEPLRHRGDFEHWIIQEAGLRADQAFTFDPREHLSFPLLDEFCGVIVTGSASMVTEREPWSVRTALWLRQVVHTNVPVLGICYGHQLLADALGGRVARNPRGREIGTIRIDLHEGAGSDPLFNGLSEQLHVQATHVETVAELPALAVRLASSSLDDHHAFRYCHRGARAWGVQFHPEFDADVIRAYVTARREIMTTEGLEPDQIIAQARDTEVGRAILTRFVALARVGLPARS